MCNSQMVVCCGRERKLREDGHVSDGIEAVVVSKYELLSCERIDDVAHFAILHLDIMMWFGICLMFT